MNPFFYKPKANKEAMLFKPIAQMMDIEFDPKQKQIYKKIPIT